MVSCLFLLAMLPVAAELAQCLWQKRAATILDLLLYAGVGLHASGLLVSKSACPCRSSQPRAIPCPYCPGTLA